MNLFQHYDDVVDHPEKYRDHVREPLDEEALAEIGRKHLSHFHVPSLPIPGVNTIEKKLVYFICDHTGAPNPFHKLEEYTGDWVELKRAELVWEAAAAEVAGAVEQIEAGAKAVREGWTGAEAERFGASLDAYLEGLSALAGSIRTSADCLKAIRSEAALAEGTIQMLINILIGSLGGLLVAEFITAGTVTPVAAAQAQLELTYVAKKIASLGSKLHLLYSDITKLLDAFHGLRGIEAMRFVFDVAPAAGSLL
ncbi:MAG TPA: hypothetical protein VGX23_09300 [Actinocrinis sp.]|nr:hypothetical protein [Actinocrinis sp.]